MKRFKRFVNRDDLLAWLDEHAPTKSVQRALSSGMPITLLGGFKPLPNSNAPGWIVRTVSKAGRVYHVAVTAGRFCEPKAYLIDHIDWKFYSSDIYRGDCPVFAERQKKLEVFERLNDEAM